MSDDYMRGRCDNCLKAHDCYHDIYKERDAALADRDHLAKRVAELEAAMREAYDHIDADREMKAMKVILKALGEIK